MAIDLMAIQPSVVSRDLRGKFVMLYGKEKSGKTTAACSFPKSLLLAFEKGYNAIGGVMAQDITKWSDMKQVCRQLEKPEVRERFSTVIIDTVPIAYDYVEQYVCAQNGVSKISDIPWGGGFSQAKKEFESTLRKITQLGYGLVLIAHSASRIEKDANGSEVEIISPDLPKRAAEICNGLVDIIGYIGTEFVNGENKRWLYTRETPTLFAGSRFKYMPPKIPFGYDELVKGINEAIDKAEKLDGISVVDRGQSWEKDETPLNYITVRNHAQDLWVKLVGTGENADADMARRISKKIEMIFGHPMKLSEATEDQVDLLNLVNLEMEDLLKEKSN